jgi:hypothetical protein
MANEKNILFNPNRLAEFAQANYMSVNCRPPHTDLLTLKMIKEYVCINQGLRKPLCIEKGQIKVKHS